MIDEVFRIDVLRRSHINEASVLHYLLDDFGDLRVGNEIVDILAELGL